MTSCVLDASAVIALFRKEPGWENVLSRMHNAAISTVNMSEAIQKMVEKGTPTEKAIYFLRKLPVARIVFDEDLAIVTASLRSPTRQKGVSFGDRACLALALIRNCPAVTSDSKWKELNVGASIELFR